MEGCLRTARSKDSVDIGEVTVDVEKSKTEARGPDNLISMTKTQANPISPSGRPLEQEI